MRGFLRVSHPVTEFPHLIQATGEPAVGSPLAKHPDPAGQVQSSLRGYITQAVQHQLLHQSASMNTQGDGGDLLALQYIQQFAEIMGEHTGMLLS